MNGEILLQTVGLTFSYEDGKSVLYNINVAFRRGEKVAVLGANGAGKSTFFLLLNGVLQPKRGQVFLYGEQIGRGKKDLIRLHQEIGIVFQDADNQMIASTVKQEVSFGPMNLKLPRGEVIYRTNQALRYMNLQEYEERPPHSLSGGEKKRVSIADIIAMKGAIIAFDEPTSSLDPVNEAMLESVLEDLSKEGKTLLVSTHNVDFAYRWADRVIVFDKGSLIKDGTPLDIFRDQELLEKCNLKRPTLLGMYDIMKQHHIINSELEEAKYPRTVEEFEVLLR